MTELRVKIGQMFIVGVQGEALTRDEQLIIEQCAFGGFILFSHNCREPKQILSLCRALWETGTELPPLIAIDHPELGKRIEESYCRIRQLTKRAPRIRWRKEGRARRTNRAAREIVEEIQRA